MELFEKTTEIYPTISYGFCGRADVFRLRGDLDNAIDAFQKARTQFPTMSAPIAGLAEAFRDAHRFSDAIDAYNYAAREFPFDSWCRNGRANVLRTTWQLPDALAAYDQILLDLPSNIGAATGRANVLKLLRQYPSSLEAYDLILARRPNHKQARYGRAAVLALLGRSEEALSILPASAAMAQARVDWFGLHTRSMLLLKLHRVDEALDLLENAVLKIPFYKYREMFERALGLARLKATLYEAAVNILRAARDPVGKIINIHALCTMGRTAEAREVYRAVKAEHADVAVELRKAVGALCGVEPSGPTLTGQQIFEFECEAILQEVAA